MRRLPSHPSQSHTSVAVLRNTNPRERIDRCALASMRQSDGALNTVTAQSSLKVWAAKARDYDRSIFA
jgi:hypothetical protein